MALRRFNMNLGKEILRFRSVVDSLSVAEGVKLEGLPESLRDSGMATAIVERQQELEELLEKLEGFDELVEGIASDWDIDLRRGKALANVDAPSPTKAMGTQERKSSRLFMLVAPSTREALDCCAQRTGLSMNQILNTAIGRYIADDEGQLA